MMVLLLLLKDPTRFRRLMASAMILRPSFRRLGLLQAAISLAVSISYHSFCHLLTCATGKYTIGGADARVPNTLGPALGLDKHGTFEIDGSISRPDNHFGNQADFIEQRWETVRQQAVDNGGGFFGIETWIANQEATYNTARATNPDFFAGVKYFAVSLAERSFVFRGLPNGTNEEVPDSANIEPFFLNNTFPEEFVSPSFFFLISSIHRSTNAFHLL